LGQVPAPAADASRSSQQRTGCQNMLIDGVWQTWTLECGVYACSQGVWEGG
jgi:hypothetical protein